MPNTVKELKDKIVTECTSWSVEHMSKMMDELIKQAEEQGRLKEWSKHVKP